MKFRRYLSAGSSSTSSLRVDNYTISELNLDNVKFNIINSPSSFNNKCDCCESCIGHLMKYKDYILLPSEWIDMKLTVSDDLAKAGYSLIMSQSTWKQYRSTLIQYLMGKKGLIRGRGFGGKVDGSFRLVIIPEWTLMENEIMIPRYICDNIKVPCIREGTVVYEGINEGEYVLIVRPPSLSCLSVQPMKVRKWDKHCIGFPPFNCNDYHADFDGDEVQGYPLKSDGALKDIANWKICSERMFDMSEIANIKCSTNITIENFMIHSNHIIEDMINIIPSNIIIEKSRIKSEHLNMCQEFMIRKLEDKEFVENSIKGMNDISRQQLNQGRIGYMSRISRVSTFNFSRASQDISINTQLPILYGTQLMSRLCAKLQQEYLDSHRPGIKITSTFKPLESFILCSSTTLIIRSDKIDKEAIWGSKLENNFMEIIDIKNINSFNNIIASYNSLLLHKIDKIRRRSVAKYGLYVLLRMKNIPYIDDEIEEIVDMIMYSADKNIMLLTTPEGAIESNLPWIDILLLTSWTSSEKIILKNNKNNTIKTWNESMLFGSFKRFL